MIGAPVPGVVNALQVTIPGRSPSVPSVKALGNAREMKKDALIHNSGFQKYKKAQFWHQQIIKQSRAKNCWHLIIIEPFAAAGAAKASQRKCKKLNLNVLYLMLGSAYFSSGLFQV